MDDVKRDLEYFTRLWEKGNETPSAFQHTKETWDKRADKWATAFDRPNAKEKSRRRMLAISDYLRRHDLLCKNHNVIDVGCGQGEYVAEFAGTANHVVGADLSRKMLEYAELNAKNCGANNVAFVQCDFNEADVRALGWEKAFDLVFTCITPAFSGMAALEKINSMSRGWCFNNGWAYQNNNIGNRVKEALLAPGESDGKRPESTYSLFNILWLKGCRPRVEYYKETSEDLVKADEETAAHYASIAVPRERVDEAAIKKTLRIMNEMAVDGFVTEQIESMFVWMLWQAAP
jgi:SAM-dependent methyltransferase